APSPRISRACVNGLNLALPAALSSGLHSPRWAYAWVGSRSDPVCALALNDSIAVTSAATAPRQSMDFGIIDTTPSHGFKSPAFTALRTYTQHQRDASALTLLPGGRKQSTASRHSHRVRLVLILDFGFWAARAAARRTH